MAQLGALTSWTKHTQRLMRCAGQPARASGVRVGRRVLAVQGPRGGAHLVDVAPWVGGHRALQAAVAVAQVHGGAHVPAVPRGYRPHRRRAAAADALCVCRQRQQRSAACAAGAEGPRLSADSSSILLGADRPSRRQPGAAWAASRLAGKPRRLTRRARQWQAAQEQRHGACRPRTQAAAAARGRTCRGRRSPCRPAAHAAARPAAPPAARGRARHHPARRSCWLPCPNPAAPPAAPRRARRHPRAGHTGGSQRGNMLQGRAGGVWLTPQRCAVCCLP